MDPSFWHQRWETNQIAFHQSETNPLLARYFGDLSLDKGSRIFLPLCGKTLDIPWLLSNGYRIVGAELSQTAIDQLFAELGVKPTISNRSALTHFSSENIEVFVGDIFDLTQMMLGKIDAVYDRAALVALPLEMRRKYADHLRDITDTAPQLLLTYEYDQNEMAGPPFSISEEDVHQYYGHDYAITHLASVDVPDGLKGKCAATENVWCLRRG